jgi:hypothetical protein
LTETVQLKPPVIIWFQRIMIIRLAIVATHGAILKHRVDLANSEQPAQVQAMLARHPYIITGAILQNHALSAVFTALTLYLVIRQRNAGARAILAVWLVIVSVRITYVAATRHLSITPLALMVDLTDVLLAICLWLLFRPDARKWFAGTLTNPTVSKEFE